MVERCLHRVKFLLTLWLWVEVLVVMIPAKIIMTKTATDSQSGDDVRDISAPPHETKDPYHFREYSAAKPTRVVHHKGASIQMRCFAFH